MLQRCALGLAGAAGVGLLLIATPGAAQAGGVRAKAAGNGFTPQLPIGAVAATSGRVHVGQGPRRQLGDIFTDALNSIQGGPLILSPQGELVWFDPLPGGRSATDVTVRRYQGQSVLTYWQGYGGVLPAGDYVILNHHYETLAVVNPGYAGKPGNGRMTTST